MSFLVIGMSHHSAPEAIRQQYILNPERITQFLNSLQADQISLIILSTCNRLEIYSENLRASELQALWDSLLELCLCQPYQSPYLLRSQKSIEHVFKVALGLDSRVLGEHQILGQMRKAYQRSQGANVLSQGLRKLFERAFHLSKKIRYHWQKSSLGLLACKYLAPLVHERHILLIGAGDIIKDFLLHSHYLRNTKIYLSNRTYANAILAAKRSSVPIEVIPFEQIFHYLALCPVIVVGISTTPPFIFPNHLADDQIVDLIDFGIPSALCPSLAYKKNIRLKSLDSFQNGPLNSEELCDLWLQIQQQTALFEQEMRLYKNRHVIVDYRKSMETQCQFLAKNAIAACQQGCDPSAIIAELTYKMQQKLLHAPSMALKQSVLESHHLDSFYHSADAIALPSFKSFESL